MGWKEAIDGLLIEFRKINLKTGIVEEAIDLKSVESKLRILSSEADRTHIGKEHLIAIFPAVFLCLSSDDQNLRQSVARFLHNLKDFIEATSCSYSDWKSPINSEFVKLCADRLILIVEEYSDDWIEPWLLLVNILFTDVEGGSFTDISLFNHLLSVVEKAFKTAKVKTEKFKTAFQTWERFCTILADSLSYNKFLTTAKRLNLLVLPFLSIRHLSADPYKHQAWFHVVEKIGLHSQMTVHEIVSPFLHFLIENSRIFTNYKEDVGNYLKVMSQSSLVFSKHSSELLKCLELAIEHESKQEDIISTWTSLCGYISSMDYEYFKKLLYFIKSTSENNDKKELTVELCLIAYQYKLFDFKSVYLDDIKLTCEEVFPITITSPLFRDSVFQKILVEMLDMAENLDQEEEIDEEGCMSPIMSMWELMVTVYSGFVDASLDSRFIPNSFDVAIIRDLMILPLSQPLNETPQEKNSTGQLLSSFIQCLAKKTKSDLFSSDFLKKLGNGIRSSKISLDNCLWLASFASKLEYEVNMIPLMTMISKSIASCSQPKAVLQFLNVLDKVTEKTSLKINFKAMLNYLRKFSSTYEPPYDQQIRQLAHSLLKRLPESGEIKPTPLNNTEPEEKKHNIRTPTFHSNFLSRLSKAEEKKNNKNVLAASIFPRNSEEAETNKENKQNIACKDPKVDEIHVSPSSYRFAKSSAFILDNPESSESLPVDNFEPKVANLKISTDFHKAVSPSKINTNRVEPGLSPTLSSSSKNKPLPSPKSSPLNDKAPNLEGKSPNVQKNKYSFLENNSLDNQDFVFVPPKNKASPLTKHQKEMLSKRREEIPALYQDLSQDTQNTTELSSNSQSSQENSAFTVLKKEDNKVLESQENHKKVDDITSIIEENAVFKNLNDCEIKKDEVVENTENQTEEEMKTKGLLSPKRLNFEGICGTDETSQKSIKSSKDQADALTPSRKFARKSTSKYRKTIDNNDEVKALPLKRKFDEHLDDDISNSSPCKKPALETNTPKNEATSLETKEHSSQKKRRGRKPKQKSEDGNTKGSAETPVKNIPTSPVQTRRKRKSMTLKAESELVHLDNINETDNKNHNESQGINGNRDSVVCTNTAKAVVDPVEISCENESILAHEKNNDLKSNVENNESLEDLPSAPSKCAHKENVEVSDLPTPEVQNPVEDVLSVAEQLPETPPSVETPHRRKKSKQYIQHNEFSPKMLRRGRVQVKTSPKEEKANKNVKRKSLDLDKGKQIDEKRDKSPAINIDSEVNKAVEMVIKTNSDKSDVSEIEETTMETDQMSENRSSVNEPMKITDEQDKKPDDIDVKLGSNQKSSSSHLMSSKQTVAIENKVAVNSKTSPTRTMRIMQLVVNSGLQSSGNQSESNQSGNGVENNYEDVKETPSNIQKSIIKYNNSSRASLIMKNLKDRSKPTDSGNKIDSKQVMTVEKDSVDEMDVNSEITSTNDDEDSPSQNLGKGKRKSLFKSPTYDKKVKNGEGLSPGTKVKKSGLDSWLIKKDKNATQEVSNVDLNITNELIDTSSTTQVIISVEDPKCDFNDAVESANDGSLIENLENPSRQLNNEQISHLETNQTESGKTAEDTSQNPSRWPKRWRKDKKPSDFMYSPLKRNKSPDNKTSLRKPKQAKQMELSPSKPYSFVNWPKGDCETWIACEPTPPEASPASAILKRRTAYPSPTKTQISPNVTPKKRVSFLDPPVSKGLLYSKEEYGGEVQHALNDTGTPTPRRKKLLMGVSNYEKEDKGITPIENHLKSEETISSSNQIKTIDTLPEAVTPSSVTEPGSTADKQPDSFISEISENGKEKDTVIVTVTEKNIDNSSIITEGDPCKTSFFGNETNSKVTVTIIENEENHITTVEVIEQFSEPMDVVREEVENNYTYPLEPNASNESQASDESHSQEQEIDIVEKVVGKVSEGSAACIVEPIETCSVSELLSDESISNAEQDYISITDDILLSAEQEQVVADKNNKAELSLESAESLTLDNDVTAPEKSPTKSSPKKTLDHSVERSTAIKLETGSSSIDKTTHETSDENVSGSNRISENQMTIAGDCEKDSLRNSDKITLNVVKIEVEPEEGEAKSVKRERLDHEISGDENLSETSSIAFEDASYLSHTSLPTLIKEKCQEFNRFFESIDIQQTPSSSLQDILSVISTMTILAQKVAGQP